jgi:hypothetical protein
MTERDVVVDDTVFFTGYSVEGLGCCVSSGVKNKKASVACEESQTWLALVCSLAPPYDAQYPLIRLNGETVILLSAPI